MKILMILVLAAVVIGGGYWVLSDYGVIADNADMEQNNVNGSAALVETNYGNFKIAFYPDDAVKTVENFQTLVGKGYYNGLVFHRVIKNFMIQGGDPFCKPDPVKDSGACGTGGPGYKFADELNPNTASAKAGYKKGVVAMANSGPNTNGSQFFVMVADVPLPYNYTIFGKVIEGQDVVDAIGLTPTNSNDRPKEAVVIKKVVIQ